MRGDNTMGYSTEWQPYKGDYDKLEYDVKLKDGRIFCNCYPNARKFNSFDPKLKNGGSANLHEGLVAEIRITPFDKQKLGINDDSLYNQTKLK